MWGILRIILLVGNAVFFAWLAYIMATVPGSAPDDPTAWLGYGIFAFMVLNFFYLLLGNGPSNWRNWRIFRLIGLWLDAKENELRKRAGQDR